MHRKKDDLTSRELLERIGLDESSNDLLDDEPLEDLRGDLGGVLRERYRSFMQPHRFAPAIWSHGSRG